MAIISPRDLNKAFSQFYGKKNKKKQAAWQFLQFSTAAELTINILTFCSLEQRNELLSVN